MSNVCRYVSTAGSIKDGFHFEGLESTEKYAVRTQGKLWLKLYSWGMPHQQCNNHRISGLKDTSKGHLVKPPATAASLE